MVIDIAGIMWHTSAQTEQNEKISKTGGEIRYNGTPPPWRRGDHHLLVKIFTL